MMTKVILAALLALTTVPALAATSDGKASAIPTSTDEARAQVGKEIAARRLAEACACNHRGETALRDSKPSAANLPSATPVRSP
jgi:hypothetical protein